MSALQFQLPLILPEVPDARDQCVARLQALLSGRRGVLRSHVKGEGEAPEFCVHFDPEQISTEELRRLVHAAGADLQARVGHELVPLKGASSEDAGRRIEESLRAIAGVLGASVNLPAQVVRIEFDRQKVSADSLRREIAELGFTAAASAEAGESWYARNRELVWSLIGAGLLLAAFVLERAMGRSIASIALYVASYGFGGFDLLRHTFAGLRRGHFHFDIDLLMLLAAIGAAILGDWAEGAFLLFLFSLAHSLEHYALGRARASIRALADLAPPKALVKRGEQIREVPVAEVKAGEVVLVRPGDRIAVDGRVESGESAVNQAPITGESVPVEKGPGDEVFAGTVNGEGALNVVTTRAAGDRTLDRVMKLVEEAQTAKAPTQLFTDRFERIFVPAVLVADVLLLVLPPLLGALDWSTSFYRAMALLVAASPCALALGTPATVLAGIARAARKGVLIKGGAHLENLGMVRAFAFDKTGTLTVGRPEVSEVLPEGAISATALLQLAASVERHSQHPLAQAVVRKATAEGLKSVEPQDVQSITGKGIRARIDGQLFEIGNARLFAESGIEQPLTLQTNVKRLQEAGRSVMLVRRETEWLGVLGMADQPRVDVARTLKQVRALGVRALVMLTGDHQGVGEAMGRRVGVTEVRAELLPEDKVKAIEALRQKHGTVAMVGDGVNDAPALAQATVGIAMGGAGTAAALETADIALMSDDLGQLPFAIGLARKARAIIRQNLALSMLVIVVLLGATISGVVGIGLAVFVHEGSTLLVIGNALRLLRYG